MSNKILGCWLLLSITTVMGCAMCDNSLDCQYPAYGGVRDRIDRVNGRVGSIFDPAASLEHVLNPVDDGPALGEFDADASIDSLDDSDASESGSDDDDDDVADDLLRKMQDMIDQLPGADDADET